MIFSEMIITHNAFTWSTEDIRASLDEFEESEQKEFYEKVGESHRDLRAYFGGLLDDRGDIIMDFIKGQIADAIAETLADK